MPGLVGQTDGCPKNFGLTSSLVLEIDIGVITMWSGSIGNIPRGWVLCDGTNGTPDLRDRFMASAGVTFAVDESGGSVNHDHEFTSNLHSHALGAGTAFGFQIGLETTSDSTAISGTTDPASIVPPFYALAYIQFLGV